MRFETRQKSILFSLAALVWLSVLPATADWLVTGSGERIETAGPWEIRGKLVVFTLPGGGLSSLRLADVDLEASERLTAGGGEPEASPSAEVEEETKAAVLVLTDADVAHVGPEAAPAETAEASAEAAEPGLEPVQPATAAPAGAVAPGEGLTVANWDQTFDDAIDGVVVSGRVENRSEYFHTEVTLLIGLYDVNGEVVARAPATLDTMTLPPGQASGFQASFAGVIGFERPEFRFNSAPLQPRAEGAGGEGEDLAGEPEIEP